MAMNWKRYPLTKKIIKLKYLRLLKKRFEGESFHIRDALTQWSVQTFTRLKLPMKQFGGTFGHKAQGIFIREHGFLVTEGAIKREAERRGLTPIEYIDELIAIVWSSGPPLRRRVRLK